MARKQQKLIAEIKKHKVKGNYKKVHIVINPASGKKEPVLNAINKVFAKHDINWSISVTKKFGDATRFSKKAAKSKVDLIAGYGGDGTQHEIVNGTLGSGVTLAILPGGTGNGFAAGLGLPKNLEEALELICVSKKVAKVDVAKVDDKYFLSRLYVGIEPEIQTSREQKDKHGVFAYAQSSTKQFTNMLPASYRLKIDGKVIETDGVKLYVVNSASTGVNIPLGHFNPTDGILDVFMIDSSFKSIAAFTERFLDRKSKLSNFKYWRVRKIEINTIPDQPVWADGEYIGRTPKEINIIPKAINVVVPD